MATTRSQVSPQKKNLKVCLRILPLDTGGMIPGPLKTLKKTQSKTKNQKSKLAFCLRAGLGYTSQEIYTHSVYNSMVMLML